MAAGPGPGQAGRRRLAVGHRRALRGGHGAAIYPNGGGLQWGGRYFLLAVPVAVPFVLGALRERVSGLARRHVVALTACVVLAGLAGTYNMAAVLVSFHRSEGAMATELARAAAQTHPGDGGRPVVLSASFAVGDTWSTYFDYRALAPANTQLPRVGRRLRAAGVAQFLMVSASPAFDDLLIGGTYRVTRVLPARPIWPSGPSRSWTDAHA